MGFLYEKDRRTEVASEVKLPVVDWDAALAALAKRESLHRVCCLSGLQPADGERFIADATAAHAAVLSLLKGGELRDKTEAAEKVRGMVGPDFPVNAFLSLLLKHAGDDGKVATWSALSTAAQTEAA